MATASNGPEGAVTPATCVTAPSGSSCFLAPCFSSLTHCLHLQGWSNISDLRKISSGTHSIRAAELSRLSSCCISVVRFSTLRMEALRSSEPGMSVYQTSRRHVPESLLYFVSGPPVSLSSCQRLSEQILHPSVSRLTHFCFLSVSLCYFSNLHRIPCPLPHSLFRLTKSLPTLHQRLPPGSCSVRNFPQPLQANTGTIPSPLQLISRQSSYHRR